MENLYIFIYLIGVVNNLNKALGFCLGIAILIFVILWINSYLDERTWFAAFVKTKIKTILTYTITAIMLLVILPSKSTMYAMLAATGLNQAYTALSESDTIAPIVGKSFKLIEKELDVRLSELSENKNTK